MNTIQTIAIVFLSISNFILWMKYLSFNKSAKKQFNKLSSRLLNTLTVLNIMDGEKIKALKREETIISAIEDLIEFKDNVCLDIDELIKTVNKVDEFARKTNEVLYNSIRKFKLMNITPSDELKLKSGDLMKVKHHLTAEIYNDELVKLGFRFELKEDFNLSFVKDSPFVDKGIFRLVYENGEPQPNRLVYLPYIDVYKPLSEKEE